MFVSRALSRLSRFLGPKAPEKPWTTDAFEKAVADLSAGDVVIDCGANVGDYTRMMAAQGATVHAFEPDPDAFEILRAVTEGLPNVHVYAQAVSTRNGVARFYIHEDREAGNVAQTNGSSLLASKSNVNLDDFREVETVDFAEFVKRLGTVKILKMDIEGAEVEVLNHLLDEGCAARIATAFVELHDRKNPSLRDSTAKLRARVAAADFECHLDWH